MASQIMSFHCLLRTQWLAFRVAPFGGPRHPSLGKNEAITLAKGELPQGSPQSFESESRELEEVQQGKRERARAGRAGPGLQRWLRGLGAKLRKKRTFFSSAGDFMVMI